MAIRPTEQTLYRQVTELVKLGVGAPEIEVLHSPINRKSPDTTYATIRQAAADNRGLDWSGRSNAGGTDVNVDVVSPIMSMWEVNFYRHASPQNRSPFEVGREFRAWCYGSTGKSEIKKRGFVFQRTSGVRFIPAIAGARWEERAQVDVWLFYYQIVEQTIDSIGSVPLTVNSSGTITISEG